MNKIKACLLLTVCCEEFVQKSFRVSCARMGLQVKSGSGWRSDVDSGEGPQEQFSALHCWKGRPRLQRLESMRCRDSSYHTISYTTYMRCFTDRCTVWKGKFCLRKIRVFINLSPRGSLLPPKLLPATAFPFRPVPRAVHRASILVSSSRGWCLFFTHLRRRHLPLHQTMRCKAGSGGSGQAISPPSE